MGRRHTPSAYLANRAFELVAALPSRAGPMKDAARRPWLSAAQRGERASARCESARKPRE